ncbi:hypothetical protein [Methanobrevibacter sp.]|uniref:hypothetical protein n=1 Tax=Methanobrevibacter sp. TaxID=66852 RepID=UPI0038703F65
MKVDRKAKFCIFFVIAILALGLSNFAAAFTGGFVSTSLPGINDTDKMIALDDDNFSPASINAVNEQKKVVEEVNETDNSTDSNSTIEDNTDDGSNRNNNQNSDSNSNNNENGGGDNSHSKPSSGQTDTGDDE